MMLAYQNGDYPLRLFVHRGANVYLTPSLNARWNELVRLALAKYGIRLYITGDVDGLGGWNGYRPYAAQVAYRKHYGIMAAVPRTSSHGGKYRGAEVFAADVANWNDLAPGNESLAWARFAALAKTVGLTVNFVTPKELWHIGDFNYAWSVPVFGAVAINPGTTNRPPPAPEPKEIRVNDYPRRSDATAKSMAGREVKPGGTFFLHTELGQPTSAATNIVGKLGPYSISVNVYAEGQPGDALEVQLWRVKRGEEPSKSHVQRFTFDDDRLLRNEASFVMNVDTAPSSVFVLVTAIRTNKKPLNVTLLDADARLFTVA